MATKLNLTRVPYSELNSRQKEIYNFSKAASVLVEFGYNCIKLSDDWQDADFIAYHMQDHKKSLRVQLKGRCVVYRKYLNKDLYICFEEGGDWYLYPHDWLYSQIDLSNTKDYGLPTEGRSFPSLSKGLKRILKPYRIE